MYRDHPLASLRQYYRDSQAARGLITSMRKGLAKMQAEDGRGEAEQIDVRALARG